MSRTFLITPGRSGTYWISALILAATNLPLTGNPEFFSYDKKEAASEREEVVDKLWDNLPQDYVCTSLLPRMGYIDPLREKGARFIHLKRNISDNAYSMYRMHFTPGRAFRGNLYHPNPESSENILRLRGTANLSDYQLCLWACLETRAVAQRNKDLGADTFEFDIDEINDHANPERLVEFLEWIGVEYNIDYAKLMVGKKMNTLQRYASSLLPAIEEGVRVQETKELFYQLKDLQVATASLVGKFSEQLGVS